MLSRSTLPILALLLSMGCSDGSSSDLGALTVPDPEQALAVAATTQTTAATSALALEACLNQVDPANFAAVPAPPTTSATGGLTSGTVTLDFGAGTTVNNATYSGVVNATYSVTGTSLSIQLDLAGLSIQTSAAGAVSASGALSITANLSGTTTANATVNGTATYSDGTTTVTATPNLTVGIDATARSATLNGDLSVNHSLFGTWDARFQNVLARTDSSGARSIDAGVLSLDRASFLPLDADFTFTAPNSGTLSIGGALSLSTSFTL